MTRREFLGAAAAAPLAGAARQPNVVFLAVDDMNDWVGCLNGYPGVRSPNIDRLAQTGVLFSNIASRQPLPDRGPRLLGSPGIPASQGAKGSGGRPM